MPRWLLVAVLIGLTGCAGKPLVPPGEIRFDTAENADRLQRVIEPLLVANADLCRGNIGVLVNPRGQEFCAIGAGIKRDNVVNAYTDGRTLLVTSAMMAFVKNDDELAGILGHEIGHVIKGHVDDKKPWILAGAVLDGAARGQGVYTDGAFQKLGAVVFNKDREREADRWGAFLMARAGFDVRQAAMFWDRMPSGPGGWLASHPQSPERVQAMLLLYEEILEYKRDGRPLVP